MFLAEKCTNLTGGYLIAAMASSFSGNALVNVPALALVHEIGIYMAVFSSSRCA